MLAKYAYYLILLAKYRRIHRDPHNDNYIQIKDRKASVASDSGSSSDSDSASDSASDSSSVSGSVSGSASVSEGKMIDFGEVEEVPRLSHKQILENISAFDRAIEAKDDASIMQSLIKIVNHIHLLTVDMIKIKTGYEDLTPERKAQIDTDIKEYYGWFTDPTIVEDMLPYIKKEHSSYKLKEKRQKRRQKKQERQQEKKQEQEK